MITFYTTPTSPNAQKVRIMLEESGLAYTPWRVRTHEGENRSAEYLAISPTGAVPAITDSDTGAAVFESAAVLIYLAEKSGRFLPAGQPGRADVLKWLLFEAASVGPVLENLYRLAYTAEDPDGPAAREQRSRLADMAGVLERALSAGEYFAGECSIADFALFPWMMMLEDFAEMPVERLPAVAAWLERMQARPGLQRALGAPA